ncbi:hypothetical protein C8F01DRAFT_546497 [Mycena amicta]|nr:hypothetical protein C8F01DRAFT_546497 [Mycena amicta]
MTWTPSKSLYIYGPSHSIADHRSRCRRCRRSRCPRPPYGGEAHRASSTTHSSADGRSVLLPTIITRVDGPPIALPRPPNSALATPASRTIQSTQWSKHYAYGPVPIIRPGSEAVHLAPDDGYRRLVKNDRKDSALPTSRYVHASSSLTAMDSVL